MQSPAALNAGPQVVLGGGQFGGPKIPVAADVKAWADLFHSHGHTRVDTSPSYPLEEPGKSEKLLAESRTSVTAWCTIDSKVLSFGKGAHSRDSLLKSIEQSLTNPGVQQVDIMYLHMPCLDTPLEETAGAMNEAYQKGWFKRFGLSNYTPWHVEELCEISKKNGWVQPTVYQGQYNPVCRLGEKDLIPVLRKYGIAFFAYTPSAAGLFSGKVSADSVNLPDGRWSNSSFIGKFFSSIYLRPELLEAADKVHTKAMEHGFNGHEAALRWCLHHSVLKKELGDGIVIGASSIQHLEENLKACDGGPLPDDVVKVFEEIWPLAEPVAPFAYVETPPEDLNEELEGMQDKK